jgi:hypothetical protein
MKYEKAPLPENVDYICLVSEIFLLLILNFSGLTHKQVIHIILSHLVKIT